MEMEDLDEYYIPKDALDKLKDPKLIQKQIREGKTFQEILGYEAETMEKFYQTASVLFQREEYAKSADAFVFLTTLNPYVHSYWLGLGMSEQLLESYQAALLAYAMAILTNVENPLAHYHSGNCYLALNDVSNALQSYEMAIRSSQGKSEHEKIKERAMSAKSALEDKS